MCAGIDTPAGVVVARWIGRAGLERCIAEEGDLEIGAEVSEVDSCWAHSLHSCHSYFVSGCSDSSAARFYSVQAGIANLDSVVVVDEEVVVAHPVCHTRLEGHGQPSRHYWAFAHLDMTLLRCCVERDFVPFSGEVPWDIA